MQHVTAWFETSVANLSRRFRVDITYLLRGGFWLVVGQFAASLGSLVLAVIFAHYVPKDIYGEYKYLLSIVAILSIPTLTGMDSAVSQAAAKGLDGSLIAGLRAKIRWGSVGAVGALGFAIYYLVNGNSHLATAFALIAIFLPFADTLAIFHSYLEGKKMFRLSVVYRTVAQLISITCLGITVFFSHSLFTLLIAYFLPYTVVRFLMYRIVIRRYGAKEHAGEDAEVVRLGFHFSAMDILATISGNLDRILLFHFIGAAGVAVYSFAQAPVVQMRSMLNNVVVLALPKFAQQSISQTKEDIVRKIALFEIPVLLIVGVYVVAAPWLFSLFFPAYMDSVWYSQLFAAILIFTPKNMLGTALTAHARKNELYIGSVAMNGSRIILLFILLPLYGITGAILSLIIAHIIHGFVAFYLLRKAE